MLNIIRTLCIIIFFGLLTACGGGGGGNTASAPMTTPITNPTTPPDDMTPPTTMPPDDMTPPTTMPPDDTTPPTTPPDDTNPPPPTTNPSPPAEPTMLGFDSPVIGAIDYTRGSGTRWIIIVSVAADRESRNMFGRSFDLERLSVNKVVDGAGPRLPEINRASLHAHGNVVPLVENGVTAELGNGLLSIAFETRTDITMIVQLCSIPWLVPVVRSAYNPRACGDAIIISSLPDMRHVVYAVMADGFNRGFAFGESGFSFSGKYDGNNRAAGFTYDMGGYAIRTDYIRLPSKQNGNIWLDTYRFGIIRPINDEARFFAGVDSYKNAIFVIDTNGKNTHRLGIAAGNGYALKYEYRLNL